MASALVSFVASLFAPEEIDEETEELRMLTGFEPSEIHRLHSVFLGHCVEPRHTMTRKEFLEVDCIARNPLKQQICACFDLHEGEEMDFEHFLVGLSHFNSPGKKEEKMKTAFRLHDNDDDGVISFDDMKAYVKAITHEALEENEISEVAEHVFSEFPAESRENGITYHDFQQTVSLMDFQAKLTLPF